MSIDFSSDNIEQLVLYTLDNCRRLQKADSAGFTGSLGLSACAFALNEVFDLPSGATSSFAISYRYLKLNKSDGTRGSMYTLAFGSKVIDFQGNIGWDSIMDRMIKDKHAVYGGIVLGYDTTYSHYDSAIGSLQGLSEDAITKLFSVKSNLAALASQWILENNTTHSNQKSRPLPRL